MNRQFAAAVERLPRTTDKLMASSTVCPSSNDLRPIGWLCNGVSGPSSVKVRLRFGDGSSGKAIQLSPHTLSTNLNPLEASGRLSRLMAASSPGVFMVG